MFFLLAALVFQTSVATANPNEQTIQPTFQNLSFIALSHAEVDLEIGARFALMNRRATELCEYAKMPAGRYRSRVATKMNTKRVKTRGQKIAVLRRTGNSYAASAAKVGAELRTETFSTIVCLGKP